MMFTYGTCAVVLSRFRDEPDGDAADQGCMEFEGFMLHCTTDTGSFSLRKDDGDERITIYDVSLDDTTTLDLIRAMAKDMFNVSRLEALDPQDLHGGYKAISPAASAQDHTREPVRIRIAGNTAGPALLTLESMGYTIGLAYTGIERDGKVSYDQDWEATKPGISVSATNPVELLGLAMIAEKRGAHWQVGADADNPLSRYEDQAKTYDEDGREIVDA